MNNDSKNDKSAFYDQFYKTHDFRRYTFVEKPIVTAIVKRFGLQPSLKLMDLGCGTGLHSSLFSKFGLEVTGIDFSKTAIEIASHKFPNICFEERDAYHLPYENSSFNVIYAHGFSIFGREEMTSSSPLLSSLIDLLKPGGLFILVSKSALTDQNNKGKTWLYYKTSSFLAMFSEVKAIHSVKTYTLFPQAVFLLSSFAFSSLISKICKNVTKLTGMPLRIYFFIQKN